jgi:hypothetical protein
VTIQPSSRRFEFRDVTTTTRLIGEIDIDASP